MVPVGAGIYPRISGAGSMLLSALWIETAPNI